MNITLRILKDDYQCKTSNQKFNIFINNLEHSSNKVLDDYRTPPRGVSR